MKVYDRIDDMNSIGQNISCSDEYITSLIYLYLIIFEIKSKSYIFIYFL